MTTKSELLFNEKPVKILLGIKNIDEPYSSKLNKRIDTTYSHTVQTISKIEDMGLLAKETDGRKQLLRLTQEGKRLAEALKPVVDQMEEFEITNGQLSGQY